MFTKMLFPTVAFYFLENRPAPVLGDICYGGSKRISDRPWLVLGLVLCAHLAVFAALARPQQSSPLEVTPEPIIVSLLSAPQTASQKPALPQPAKPVKQKQTKTPVNKPAVPIIKPASLPAAPSVEQPPMPATPASAPAAEAQAKPTNTKAADTQTYQSPSFNAAYLNNPAPNYPSVSRRLGEQGLVLLRVQVTSDGIAESVELQTGSGSSRLDQAALEAVKKWRFVPAKRGEQSVSASVVVPVRFSLEG